MAGGVHHHHVVVTLHKVKVSAGGQGQVPVADVLGAGLLEGVGVADRHDVGVVTTGSGQVHVEGAAGVEDVEDGGRVG